MSERIKLDPINGGARTGQQLVDSGLNFWALQLVVESVTKSKLLEALPEGVSFTLDTGDGRHRGVRITITRDA